MDWMNHDGKNKGTKPVILTKSKTNPIQKILSLLCVKRSRGKYNTSHSGLYMFIAHCEKATSTNNFNIVFYQFIYCWIWRMRVWSVGLKTQLSSLGSCTWGATHYTEIFLVRFECLGCLSFFLVKLIINTCTYVLKHERWDFPPTKERKSAVSPFIITLSQS